MPHPMPTDPEVLAYIERTNSFYPPDATDFSVAENRAWYDRYAREMRAPHPAGVTAEDFSIPAASPERAIACRRYRKAGSTAPPNVTVLYLHGGGFILGGLESHDDACAGLCDATGLEVVAVDYRLAPEHLHPAQGDDAQAAFAHLAAQERRVIAAGDSAGGNLVAALCLRCKRGGSMPIGQILIYPGLGGDRSKGSYVVNAEAPMLTAKEGAYYFGIRTGGRERADCRDPDLMPLLAADLAGLPPAYVITADIDPIRDDGRDWVERLKAAGIEAHWRNEPQLVHGYLRARHMSRRAAESFTFICQAATRLAAG
ncbi:acetyl esterase [Rhizobiales bacterium GAS188]|nr:acetyl esterase [Rhizobiales bacterium GAS188]